MKTHQVSAAAKSHADLQRVMQGFFTKNRQYADHLSFWPAALNSTRNSGLAFSSFFFSFFLSMVSGKIMCSNGLVWFPIIADWQ